MDHQIEQLDLELEDLQADDAEAEREMLAADGATPACAVQSLAGPSAAQ